MPTLTRSKSRPKFKTSVGPVINYLTIWPQYVVHNLYQLKKCSRHQLPKHITHNTSHHTTTSNSRRRHKQCPPSRHQTMTTTSMPRATCPCLTLRHWPGTYRTGRLAVLARRQRGDPGIAAAATAALAPCAHPPTRCARAGAALAASDREGVIATCRSMTAPWAIDREGGEGATATGGREDCRGGGGRGRVWRGRRRRRGWVLLDALVLRQIL